MKINLSILSLLLLTGVARAQDPHALLKQEFRKWADDRIASGFYWPASDCNPDYIEEHGYPEDRIGETYMPIGIWEKGVVYVYADVDGDGNTDQFAAFDPYLCDGGNFMLGQTVVLTLTIDGKYVTLSTDEGLFAELEADPERMIRYDGIRAGKVDAHYERLLEDQYGVAAEESVVFDYATGKIVKE